MKKRVISFVLVLTMLGMFVPMEAFASPQTHPNTHVNTGNQRYDIVEVARTQLGYTEGNNNDTKYGDWYKKPNQPWCAMFVSWCARQANIPESILKNSAGAGHSESYFNIPYYDGSNYTPKSGDLFFTKSWSHVGLVDKVQGNYFTTIEGNSNNSGSAEGTCVCSNSRLISNFYFGVPNYTSSVVKPGKITDLSVSVGDGGKCTFRWSGVSNAKRYVVKIWKDKLWEGDSTYESEASSGHVAQLRAGSYVAYVDALNGSECVMSNTVSFTIKALNVSNLTLNKNRYCRIRNVGTGNYLTVSSDGNVVCSAKGNSTNQIWYFESLGNNKHRLTSCYNNRCLDVSNGGYKDETNVWTIASNNTDAQTWYVFRVGDAICLRPACSDCTVLDVYNNSTQNGTNVQLYTYQGSKNQQFDPEEVEYTVTYNANGGSGAPEAQTKLYNETLTLSSDRPTKSGCELMYWNTKADGSGTTYGVGATYTANADVTLYAQWTPAYDFNVDFRLDGKAIGNSNDFGTFDVYLNGTQFANDVTDYYRHAHKGTTYEIKDIKAKTGYKYEGVYSGSLSGTFNSNTTVVLNFSTIKYTVTYNANGGTGAPANQTKVHGTDLKLSSTRPTKTGYDFIYWTTNADGTGTKYYPEDLYKVNAGVTLYAQWVQTFDFNVDFRLDGKAVANLNNIGSFDVYLNGTQYENDVTEYYRCAHKGTTYEIKDIKAKTGYKYEGVYTGSLSGTFNSNTTVVLNFSTIKYTVTYNANGGTGAPANQTKVHGTDLKLSSTRPTKTGYDFIYWTTNADGTGTKYYPGDLYKVNAGVTLYAQWIQTYDFNVDFRLDGKAIANLNNIGSFDVYLNGTQYANDVTDYTRRPHKGTTYEIKDIKAKTGYKYEGVYSGSLTGTFNSNTTVVLNFSTIKYTVTYNANGGTGAPANQTKVHGTDLKLSSTRPTKTSYDFLYWTTNADGTGTKYYPEDLYKANSNVTLYAQWIQTFDFNVDFRLDGKAIGNSSDFGTFDVYLNGTQYANDVTDYTRRPHKGTTYEIKDIKAKTGYKYEGVYSGSLTGTFNSNTTVVLNFSANRYTVTYNANGGTGAPANQTKVHGTALTLSSTRPTRSGYNFVKWNTKADATGTSYTAGASYTANANVTLYAIWESTLKITTQPTNKTVNLGDPITLSLKAEGTGLTYQWYFKKASQTSFNKWNNRTHASEVVTPNATWNGIQLYCIVKDKAGTTVKSNTIKVTVIQEIMITTQPTSKTINLGDTLTLSLKAQGEGLTYQWYFKKAGQSSFNKWNGRTHASETVTPNATWNGIKLYCIVKDSSSNSVISNTITITVKTPAITITQQPKNVTASVGEDVTFIVKASGTGLTYQWQYKKVGQTSWNKWGTRTTATTIATSNATWNGMQVRCIIKDSKGNSVTSSAATITIK